MRVYEYQNLRLYVLSGGSDATSLYFEAVLLVKAKIDERLITIGTYDVGYDSHAGYDVAMQVMCDYAKANNSGSSFDEQMQMAIGDAVARAHDPEREPNADGLKFIGTDEKE